MKRVGIVLILLGLAATSSWATDVAEAVLVTTVSQAQGQTTEADTLAIVSKPGGPSATVRTPVRYQWISGQVYLTFSPQGRTITPSDPKIPKPKNWSAANIFVSEESDGKTWLYALTSDGLKKTQIDPQALSPFENAASHIAFDANKSVIEFAPDGLQRKADRGEGEEGSSYAEVQPFSIDTPNWVDAPLGLNLGKVTGHVYVLNSKDDPSLFAPKTSIAVRNMFRFVVGPYRHEELAMRYLGVNLATARKYLLAWALKPHQDEVLTSLGLNKIQNFIDMLNNTPKNAVVPSTFLIPFRWSLESELGVVDGPWGQRWGFPDSSVHEVQGDKPSYSQLFHDILAKKAWSWGSTAEKPDISGDQGKVLTSETLKYLFGPEVPLRSSGLLANPGLIRSGLQTLYSAPPAADQFLNAMNAGRETGVSSFNLRFLSGYPAEPGLVLLPPSPNLLNQSTVQNFSDLTPYLDPAMSPDKAIATAQIDVDFTKTQTLASLLVWAPASWNPNSLQIQVVTNTKGQVTLPYSVRLLKASLSGGAYSVQDENPGTDYVPYLISLNSPPVPGVIGLGLKFQPAKVLRLAVYSESFGTFTNKILDRYHWTRVDSNVTIETVATRVAGETDWLTGTGNVHDPIFLEIAGQQLTGTRFEPTSPSAWELYSPISYLRGGWETPQSYAEKVLNNWSWKVGQKPGMLRSRFPYSEIDAAPSNLSISDTGDYKSVDSPKFDDAAKVKPYPFAYGVTLAGRDGLSFSPRSPFFVEKLAGVDGPGMLFGMTYSLMRDTLNRWPDGTGARWQNRSSDTLPTVSDFLARVNGTNGDILKALTTVPVEWYLSNSRVLTDLGDLRAGDFLMGQEGSETTVALVVSNPTPKLTVPTPNTWNNIRKAVRVMTINRSLQAAVYSTWADFTDHPEAYHARRLVQTASADRTGGTAMVDPLFVDPPDQHTYGFSRKDGWQTWIPNTGELHWLGQILMQGEQTIKEGQAWSLPEQTGAEDYAYDAGNAGNISRNTGTTFTVYALSGPRKEQGVTFQKTNSELEVFKMTKQADSKYFQVQRIGNEADNPLVVKNGRLAVKNQGGYWDQWGIVATAGTQAAPVPGDDLVFHFQVGKQTVTGGRLAVYDKKLLWRANLFIKKSDPDLGGKDWNDAHPWISGNDWNHDENGVVGNGGQVVDIKPWTRFSDGKTVSGSMVYGWGNWSDPFSFSTEMSLQKTAMLNKRTQGNATFNQTYASILPWPQDTTAPGGTTDATKWNNYIFPERSVKSNASNWYWKYGSFSASEMTQDSSSYDSTKPNFVSQMQHLFSVHANAPKVPGLTSWLQYGNDGQSNFSGINSLLKNTTSSFNETFTTTQEDFSLGTDCSGLITNAMRYPGSPYINGTGNQKLGTSTFGSSEQSLEIVPGVAYDEDFPVAAIWTTTQPDPELLKYAVPGDIIYLPGHHAAIIQKITKPDDGQPLTRRNFAVIQATSGRGGTWQVETNDFWQNDARANPPSDIWYRYGYGFSVRRLKVQP